MVTLTEENVRKAHAEGCSDVKKVLETLCPELFGVKYKYPWIGKYTTPEGSTIIVLFTERKTGCCINDNITWALGHFSRDWAEDRFTPIKGIKEI